MCERLIQAEHKRQLVRAELLGQRLNLVLGGKTCRTGRGSDEAGGGFVDDVGAGRYDTRPDRGTAHVVSLTEYSHLLALDAHLMSLH